MFICVYSLVTQKKINKNIFYFYLQQIAMNIKLPINEKFKQYTNKEISPSIFENALLSELKIKLKILSNENSFFLFFSLANIL